MKTIIIVIALVASVLGGCSSHAEPDYYATAQADWDALDSNTQSTFCNTLEELGYEGYLNAALAENRFTPEHILARFDVVVRECEGVWP